MPHRTVGVARLDIDLYGTLDAVSRLTETESDHESHEQIGESGDERVLPAKTDNL